MTRSAGCSSRRDEIDRMLGAGYALLRQLLPEKRVEIGATALAPYP